MEGFDGDNDDDDDDDDVERCGGMLIGGTKDGRKRKKERKNNGEKWKGRQKGSHRPIKHDWAKSFVVAGGLRKG